MVKSQAFQSRVPLANLSEMPPEENSDLELHKLAEKVRELEEAKNQADLANKAKSEFIANMSHDLRTPLHAILSYSRFGIEKIEKIDKGKTVKYFKRIEESGKKLEAMLSKIVDLSKLEAGKMAFQMHNCSLALIIHSLEKDFRTRFETKKLRFKSEIADDVDQVVCDQNLIARAMRTLMENAVDCSSEEEEITVSLESGLSGQNTDLSYTKLTFAHYQTEIPQKEMLQDFERYINILISQPKQPKINIDMAIVCRIIKQHGGLVWVENKSANQVSYSFTIPVGAG